MRKLNQAGILVLLLTPLMAFNANAQSKTDPEVTAATSTPFAALTEEERIQNLISEDRPRLQSFVALEERLKDVQINQEDAQYKSKYLEKIISNMQAAQSRLEKNTSRLEAVSDANTLQQKITALENELATETDPVKREQLESKLADKRDNLEKKQTRITALEEKIAQLETKQAEDQQAILATAQTRQEKLQAQLAKAEAKQLKLNDKITTLEAKRSGTTNQTKITRIEKQLANNRLRAEKLSGRISRLQQKTAELEQFMQMQQGDLAQNAS